MAAAALQWQAPEQLPAGTGGLRLGPDGVGLLFGFPDASGYTRLVVRPPGGPSGSPQSLPAGMGYGGAAPVVGWFGDGSALIIDPQSGGVAFRSAGSAGSIRTPQNLGSPRAPVAIATAPSGEAIIGLQSGPTGSSQVGVAFRSPGPSGVVDIQNAQYFGFGQLTGVVLDPGGGAVVVWTNGTTLYQAVRDPGAASFSNPTIIPAPGLYRPQMAEDPSGYALLSWIGGPPGPNSYGTQVFADERAPGGAFGAPQMIGTTPTGDPTAALPGITSSGDAIVGWTAGALSTCSPNGNDSDFGAYIATSHSGSWGPQTALAGAAWPNNSAIDGVVSAGNHVAVAYYAQADHDAKCQPPVDDSSASFVETGSVGASGIVLGGPVNTVSELSTGHGQYYSAGFTAMSINASGGALYEYSQYTQTGNNIWLLAYEDRTQGAGQQPLTVSLRGAGSVKGPGIDCPSACTHSYPAGTNVALTATPANGATFAGWSGACSGTGACNVTMSTGQNVTATFNGGGVLPIVPRKLIVLRPLDPAYPFVAVTCPPDPDYAQECTWRVAAYAAFGAIPTAAKHRKAQLLGTGSLVLRPGHKGRLKIRFTAAGRRALRSGRSLRIRIRFDLRYRGSQHATFTSPATISVRHRHKHKKH